MIWRTVSPRLGFVLTLATAALLLAAVGCDDVEGVDSDLGTSLSLGGQADLSGAWTLNREESDGPGARPSRRDGDREGRRRRGGLRREFEISQDETTVTFTGPRGGSRTYYTDGRIETYDLRGDRQLEVQASWSADELVIQKTLPHAVWVDRFSLAPESGQLLVVTSIESDRRDAPIEFRRVYDSL